LETRIVYTADENARLHGHREILRLAPEGALTEVNATDVHPYPLDARQRVLANDDVRRQRSPDLSVELPHRCVRARDFAVHAGPDHLLRAPRRCAFCGEFPTHGAGVR